MTENVVVVGVDGSEHALDAVRWAAEEARLRGAHLRLVCAVGFPVVTPVGGAPLGQERQLEALTDAGADRVAAAAAVAREVVADLDIDQVVRAGTPTGVLVSAAEDAGLLVVGNRGHGGFAGLLLGSVGVSAAARAACPVVVVRGATRSTGPVVVGVDAEGSDAALGVAFEEATLRGVPLVAVHAWSEAVLDPFLVPFVDWAAIRADERKVLATALTPWTDKFPDVRVSRIVARDGAAASLLRETDGACLVVVGSRGRGVVRGPLLGSVSQALLHHASCPVLVAHAEEAGS
jgi:nucleotide-binding universal stress UspA family protein